MVLSWTQEVPKVYSQSTEKSRRKFHIQIINHDFIFVISFASRILQFNYKNATHHSEYLQRRIRHDKF